MNDAADSLQTSLEKFVDRADCLSREDNPSGNGFYREYMKLRDIAAQQKQDNFFPVEEGKKPHNMRKNRYKDILPFDDTRVILDEESNENDYINANFIKDYRNRPAYIASQGPLPHTVNDFWHMIWMYDCKVIIMACKEEENNKKKCQRYWPKVPGEKEEFGGITVTLESEKTLTDDVDDCIVRKLLAECGNETQHVVQYQYTGWPDHGIPDDIGIILEMIAELRRIRNMDPDRSPAVIHCSAGCGRTGTITAIDYAWEVLKTGNLKEDFDLYAIIKEMREQRQSMVQTPDQYEMAHLAVKQLFQEHLNLMEDHIYSNFKHGTEHEYFNYNDIDEVSETVESPTTVTKTPHQRRTSETLQREVKAGLNQYYAEDVDESQTADNKPEEPIVTEKITVMQEIKREYVKNVRTGLPTAQGHNSNSDKNAQIERPPLIKNILIPDSMGVLQKKNSEERTDGKSMTDLSSTSDVSAVNQSNQKRVKEEKQKKEKEEKLNREKEEKQKKETGEKQKKEREEKQKREKEDKLKREKEEKLNREKEEKLKREKEEKQKKEKEEKMKREKEEKLKKEKEEKLNREKEEKQNREKEEKQNREKEERQNREIEEKLKREKEERLNREIEEKLKREKEEKQNREKEERLNREKEEKQRREKEERLNREKEEKQKREKEERLNREKEEKQNREKEEKLNREKEEKQKRENEERLNREKEGKQNREKEEKLNREKEEKQNREKEEKQKREKEEKLNREKQEKQKVENVAHTGDKLSSGRSSVSDEKMEENNRKHVTTITIGSGSAQIISSGPDIKNTVPPQNRNSIKEKVKASGAQSPAATNNNTLYAEVQKPAKSQVTGIQYKHIPQHQSTSYLEKTGTNSGSTKPPVSQQERLYAEVNVQKWSSQPKITRIPSQEVEGPPIPHRGYEEDTSTHKQKGSKDVNGQATGMGFGKKFKALFLNSSTGNVDTQENSSQNTSKIKGFGNRLNKPKGPRSPPSQWGRTSN